jgi:MATE family multidrug resistance protein
MDIDIAARASEFILIATLNIPALVIQEALRRYAQAIDRGDVTLYNTMCGLLLTPVFNYVFVMRMGMGCLGVAWSVVITSYIMTVQLLLYYRYTSVSLFPHTHFTPTTAAFNGWPAYLRLALPGTLSLAAEWVGLEAQSLVAAKQGVAALGAQSIMFNLTLQLFMPSMALGMVASARVGRYLGANQPNAAKFAAKVAITLSFVSMAAMGTIVLLCGRGVGKAFTSDPGVLRAMELCIPLLVLYCLFDGLQGVGVGVMRGCGMQGIAFRINLVAYWFVALPLAYAFALRLGTHTDLDVFYDADTAGQIVAVPGWGLQGQWAAMAMTSAGVCLAVMGTLLWGMDWNKKSKEIVENEKRELERENALIQALKAEDGDGDEDEDEEIGLMRRPEPGYGSINE